MTTSAAVILAEKMAQRRSLIENAIITHCPVPCFVLRTNGTCESANRLLLQLVKHPEEYLVLRGIVGVVHPDDQEAFTEVVSAALREKQGVQSYSHRIRPKKGDDVPVYTDIYYVDSAGFVGFIMPTCNAPQNCPLHGSLLHHL
jgi:PAS domain S-box-containing protein